MTSDSGNLVAIVTTTDITSAITANSVGSSKLNSNPASGGFGELKHSLGTVRAIHIQLQYAFLYKY